MHKRIVRLMLPALVLAATPLAGGCSTNPVTGKRELILISKQQEIAMGEEAAPKFEAEFGGKVPHQQLQSYVREIGRSVAAKSDRDMPYEFTLVRSEVPNAFALPGGKVFITAGLLSRMTNQRQLAAVLGHEVGHVAARHNVKGLQRQIGAAAIVELAGKIVSQDKAEAAKAVATVIANMGQLKYSRDDEYQADQIGIRYMTRAGYNPHGMVELLQRLHDLGGSEPGSFGEMFQTHPLTSKRVAEARETIETNKEYQQAKPDTPDPGQLRFDEMRKLLLQVEPQLKNR